VFQPDVEGIYQAVEIPQLGLGRFRVLESLDQLKVGLVVKDL